MTSGDFLWSSTPLLWWGSTPAKPGYERYEEAIADAPKEAGVTIACFDPEDAAMAMDVYEQFDKGLSLHEAPSEAQSGRLPGNMRWRDGTTSRCSPTSDEFARAGLKSALPRTPPT